VTTMVVMPSRCCNWRSSTCMASRNLASSAESGSSSRNSFGDSAKDYDIRVENKKLGAGYHVTGDRPLSNIAVWSIRTVNAVEPYISMSIEPGKDFTWNLHYDYYVLPPAK